ncbi:MAG: Nif3-like dinuclear metal center hexameric protein [Veillonella sp.]|uniref:Nif3-like dinuclear metal center hexameric protein n=1 Tax=Veillonella sp. TaxID=1926307 RepID=UPI001DDD6D96|nr:Nif3-like dinuclear metal center hexameric protein [Veillonella sp.]MBS7014897.1 Nif3-like dinuclear metal center hexameric protein [Veillonella sp.]
MTIVQQVITLMEQLAPRSYAESWDNVGLMVGDRNAIVTGVLTTLDVTAEAISYAIEHDCNLIVSHHPLIFKGLKQLSCDTAQGRMINQLIQHNIAVYSAHTNLDIAPGGLNDMLAERLGLIDIKGFIKTGEDTLYKITTFVPENAADAVRIAMGNAGAGRIGNYEYCSFSAHGEGRFVGNDNSHPVIGEAGFMTVVPEVQINALVDGMHLQGVIKTMKDAHPYEEAAYDVLSLVEPKGATQYLGRIGRLPNALNLDTFREWLQEALPEANIRFAGVAPKEIQSIALCSGAGAEFIKDAARLHVDAYVTGDVKYHDAQLAKELGLLVVDAGHFGTESIVARGLCDYLLSKDLSVPVKAFTEQNDFFFL